MCLDVPFAGAGGCTAGFLLTRDLTEETTRPSPLRGCGGGRVFSEGGDSTRMAGDGGGGGGDWSWLDGKTGRTRKLHCRNEASSPSAPQQPGVKHIPNTFSYETCPSVRDDETRGGCPEGVTSTER
jgi:hypothetical protein